MSEIMKKECNCCKKVTVNTVDKLTLDDLECQGRLVFLHKITTLNVNLDILELLLNHSKVIATSKISMIIYFAYFIQYNYPTMSSLLSPINGPFFKVTNTRTNTRKLNTRPNCFLALSPRVVTER